MSCGHTTTISTGDGHPYSPSSSRCPERGIRSDIVMVARDIPEVEDDSTRALVQPDEAPCRGRLRTDAR